MLKFNYFFKFLLTYFFVISLANTSLAKDKEDIFSMFKKAEEEIENKKRQKREDKFQECMISKIKPESTEAHKSVVEEYCWNKVKKR